MKAKTYFALAALIIVATTSEMKAQNYVPKINPDKLQKILDTRFAPALESDINGIVEGSIYNIILSKKYFPTLDYTKVTEKFQRLLLESKSSAISYKAHLALLYLTNAEQIEIHPVSDYESYDYLFKQISEGLADRLLVSNVFAVE